jgi:hypothetical protein
MRFNREIKIAFLILVVSYFSAQANAQTYDGGTFEVYIPPIFSQAGVDNPAAWQKDNDNNNSQKKPNSSTVSLTYPPSASRTRQNLQNFVSKTRATDPAGAAQMAQLFANGDIIDQMDGVMQGKGLTVSNTADAYAVWWVSAWQAANGDTRDIGGATYQAVSAQAARGFAATAQFASATDAQKQEMAEAMLVQAVMIDQFKDTYANDPASKQKLADAVRQGAKKSGLDLDAMTLTEDGFVKAKERKTGAADDASKAANPNAPTTAIAANATGKGESGEGGNSNALNYALIAAAAGAGLGSVFLFGKAMGKKG